MSDFHTLIGLLCDYGRALLWSLKRRTPHGNRRQIPKRFFHPKCLLQSFKEKLI